MTAQRIWMLTPSYRPVGGVLKILDYAVHAAGLGLEVVLASAKGLDDESPLWRMEAFAGLREHPRVRLLGDSRIAPRPEDLVFFSWPAALRDVQQRLPHGYPLSRLIHFIQGERHATPDFADGWGVRALARPLTRIVVNDQVRGAIDPFLNTEGLTRVIPLGHRSSFFDVVRSPGFRRPITVGYTTWKSDIGDRVAARLADDDRFVFRAIRATADWDELRELYTASDVFLCAPGPQEGFYLPGLEAMAAECLVLTPDVGGNRAYAFFDVNSLEVPYEDVEGYVDRLVEVAEWPADRVAAFRAAGRERVAAHTLDSERQGFSDLLEEVAEGPGARVVAPTPVLPRRRAPEAFQVLTGVPRSGTTLATRLLNRLPDVVAMGEPLQPTEFMQERSRRAVLDRIEAFFRAQRRSAIADGVVTTRLVEGRDTDNYVAENDASGVRRSVATIGTLRLGRPVTPDVRMVLKDLALCTAVLPDLARRFSVTAIVRNPVAVLASWDTVDMAVRDGHSPHAEWFSETLARRLLVQDRRDRQLALLDWWFDQFRRHLPAERVVRYEDIVATSGRALDVVAPAAAELDEPLASKNVSEAYDSVDHEELVTLVLEHDTASWWQWYDRAEVEALLPLVPPGED